MKKNGWGRIVNITSCAGLENMGPVTYGVSNLLLLHIQELWEEF